MSLSVLRWIAPLGWAALLLWLGRQQGQDLPEPPLWDFPGKDKVIHAAFYGVLGALTAWAAGFPRLRLAALAGFLALKVFRRRPGEFEPVEQVLHFLRK